MTDLIARSLAATLLLLPSLLSPGIAAAQVTRANAAEKLEFTAPTYGNYNDLRGTATPPQGKVHLYVWLPPGTGRGPAVMIGHSIGGWAEGGEGQYVKPLLDAGFVVLGLDHFAGRGITRAADVPGAISNATTSSDALYALKAVAEHPRIDAARVGIMGLSMGGVTTEQSAFEFVRQKALGSSPLKFAAHVSFYAPCGQIFSSGSGRLLTGAPVLRLQAGLDETAPAAKCRVMTDAVAHAEPQVEYRTIHYPNAYHGWDNPRFTPAKFFPHHVNNGKCPLTDMGAQVRILESATAWRPIRPNEIADCVRASTGYTIGYNADVAAKARAEMLAFFRQHLKP